MATPVINEIDADQVSTDSFEFIELLGDPGASLDNYFLVLFNGSNDSSYRTIDLSGHSFDANGFSVIGSGNVPNVDIGLREENIIENGADAVALFQGDGVVDADDFGNGTAVSAIPAGFTLVDSIVYDTNDSDDAGLLAALGGPQINEGGNGRQLTESIQRLPNGSDTFITAAPTPGEPNQASPAPANVTIMEIQGADHISPYVNQDVITSGVVTAIDLSPFNRAGFYLQDPNGDGDDATPDAIFVFRGARRASASATRSTSRRR